MTKNETMLPVIDFGQPTDKSKNIIKAIGVGGGGCNAIKNMYKDGIENVSLAVCNTDSQALSKSPVPVKILLGETGLGAGGNPDIGREEARQTIEDIKKLLSDGTQMVFVTAGMGGGTGTGAAPVVAGVAKSMGILTVGIITIPFYFEKRRKIIKALKGVEDMRKNVDALLIINNERLCDVYADSKITIKEAFQRADDILSNAARSISELITIEGDINLDFRDVETTMREGGGSIMAIGRAGGEHRVENAFLNALDSPLLYGNDISKAKRILFNIYTSLESPMFVDEMNEVDVFMDTLSPDIDVIWGVSTDNSLGEDAKVIILATGLDSDNTKHEQPATDSNDSDFYDRMIQMLYKPMKGRKHVDEDNEPEFIVTRIEEQSTEETKTQIAVSEQQAPTAIYDNDKESDKTSVQKRQTTFLERLRNRMEQIANDFTKDYNEG